MLHSLNSLISNVFSMFHSILYYGNNTPEQTYYCPCMVLRSLKWYSVIPNLNVFPRGTKHLSVCIRSCYCNKRYSGCSAKQKARNCSRLLCSYICCGWLGIFNWNPSLIFRKASAAVYVLYRYCESYRHSPIKYIRVHFAHTPLYFLMAFD